MSLPELLAQLVNGLAGASTLFLLASGLSLIFGVTRIVNFAHGSLYMIGTYAGITVAEHLGGGFGFWGGIVAAAVVAAVLGVIIEVAVLKRIYHAPELFQLLGTFAVVLILKDVALMVWGPEDVLGPRAPGLSEAVQIGEAFIPSYDLFLIVLGPVVLLALQALLTKTRWGILVRAATLDREMVGALGVNQAWLFTGVFALGSFLAGLAGALQIPREPASLNLDLIAITDAFVVVVIGGLGSLQGAFLAALIIGLVKALCVALGTVEIAGIGFNLTKLTLVIEFLLMALTLAFRPWGLLGRPIGHADALRGQPRIVTPGARFVAGALAVLGLCALTPLFVDEYSLVLLTDIVIFAVFAASLHFLMGPGGMASFGHAAFFGIGAYAAALLVKSAGWSMGTALIAAPLVAALGGLVVGWFSVRLAGVYLAMLTLAFAQITWSVAFQWDDVTGGSNGLVGLWPAEWAAGKTRYFLLTLGAGAVSLMLIWIVTYSPFGFLLRAGRDAPARAEALGVDVRRVQWLAFPVSGAAAGLAGALFVFSKGSLSPEVMAIARSVDGLVMVLLGGVQTLLGPVVGAVVFTALQDEVLRHTEYWRLVLGAVVLVIVLAFPAGIVGSVGRLLAKRA